MLAARAAADLTDPLTVAPAVPAGLLAELEELRARMAVDPFGPSIFVAARPALRAAWAAETARLSGAPSLDLCAAAAARFDGSGAPTTPPTTAGAVRSLRSRPDRRPSRPGCCAGRSGTRVSTSRW